MSASECVRELLERIAAGLGVDAWAELDLRDDLHRAEQDQALSPAVPASPERSKGATAVKLQDVVIKETKPLRLAEARAVAAGLDPKRIGPVFLALAPKLMDHLQQARARPGILVHYYDQPAEDGSVGVHVGYDIGEQPCQQPTALRSSTYQ